MSLENLNNRKEDCVGQKFATFNFVRQRYTALLLIPLICWLIYSVIKFTQVSGGVEYIAIFLGHPINFVMIMMFNVVFLYHGFLGMDEIMKDYLNSKFLYEILRKTLIIICVLTHFITIINLIFYHLLFRYLLN